MFKAKYLIRLDKASFHAQFICLGEQFLELLNLIEQDLPPHIWYGADIDAIFFKTDFLKKYRGFFLKKLGDISVLKQVAQDVPQFIWGTFFAVKAECLFSDDTIEVGTEDDTFRSVDAEGVLIEIRTFDTSFFDLYSDDYHLMQKIANKYSTEILTHEEYEKNVGNQKQ